MASMMKRAVQYSNNIKRTENGEFANALKAGTPNTTPNQIGRLHNISLKMNRFFPRALVWSQASLINRLISASL
jgi:hypothetical protein